METVEDIVRDMRNENFGCDKCGDLCGECPNVVEIIKRFADRLESAVRQMRRDHDATVVDLTNKVYELLEEVNDGND